MSTLTMLAVWYRRLPAVTARPLVRSRTARVTRPPAPRRYRSIRVRASAG
ncbi:hypothetical protein ABGB07_36025 [Micromonosporaceae bacterium B7E4]